MIYNDYFLLSLVALEQDDNFLISLEARHHWIKMQNGSEKSKTEEM